MDRILVAADHPQRRRDLELALLDEDCRVHFTGSLDDAAAALAERPTDLVVVALPLGGAGALAALAALHDLEPKLPVVLITATGTTEEAIEASKAGAIDYLLEPWRREDLLRAIREGLEAGRLMRSPVSLDQDASPARGDTLVGRSKPMQEIYKVVGRVAPSDSTVLILGESGTGKELVARALYQHSRRADRPFVVVNCVAIPETLLESELFGFEKGAFTGAVGRRIGKVEQADGGTLFLDEIGDMPLTIQAKLLRLLEDRSIERIGGRRPIPVDVRILAATNRDLEAALAEGRFRADLFYRLNVVPITLPPLRQRTDDIPLLCDYFLTRLTRELGVRNPGLSAEGRRLLVEHTWPGNVRELANAMEQCLVFGRGRQIGGEEVAALLHPADHDEDPTLGAGDDAVRRWVRQAVAGGRDGLLELLLDHVTQQAVREVLALVGGNRSRAARLLGISRPTLLERIRRYGLE